MVVKHTHQRNTAIRNSRSDAAFFTFNRVMMVIIFLIYSWPLWFVVVASFSDPNLVTAGQVVLWPKGFHTGGYSLIMEYPSILRGFLNSVLYTAGGTLLNIVLTVCAAYPLSRKDFIPRKFFTIMFVFTIYFSGGLIPLFLQVKELGLYDSSLAMIIPSALSTFNVLILRSFFMNGVPSSIEEAAVLDGANTFKMLTRVVLPLAKPTLAVLVLYYAVGHWNDYFSALVFLKNKDLMPLQTVLRDILIVGKIDLIATGMDMESLTAKLKTAQTLKYSMIIISTVPLMLVYPLIQKHFVKGIMVGAVKG